MPYAVPPNFTAGNALTAAELDVLGDDIVYLNGLAQGTTFSGTEIGRATAQSIPNSTLTAVTFTAETFDFGGWWASGSLATVPAGAIPSGFTTIMVQCFATARFAANGTGTRQAAIVLNGSVSGVGVSVSALSGETTLVPVTKVIEVAAGDTLGLSVQQNSGGALNCDYGLLTIVRFAPAT